MDLVIILPTLSGGVWLVSAWTLQRTIRALLGYHRHMYEPIGKPSLFTKLWIVRSPSALESALESSLDSFDSRRDAHSLLSLCRHSYDYSLLFARVQFTMRQLVGSPRLYSLQNCLPVLPLPSTHDTIERVRTPEFPRIYSM